MNDNLFPNQKFALGQIVTTPGAESALEMDISDESATILERHATGDWGDVCAEDKVTNDEALKDGNRILSSYVCKGQKIWIISEADRSATTFLLPSEY